MTNHFKITNYSVVLEIQQARSAFKVFKFELYAIGVFLLLILYAIGSRFHKYTFCLLFSILLGKKRAFWENNKSIFGLPTPYSGCTTAPSRMEFLQVSTNLLLIVPLAHGQKQLHYLSLTIIALDLIR